MWWWEGLLQGQNADFKLSSLEQTFMWSLNMNFHTTKITIFDAYEPDTMNLFVIF